MTNMEDKKDKTAKLLGQGLALVQDTIDRTVAWGFGKLKDIDADTVNEQNKIVKAAKQAGGFIGKAGSEFYTEYERLKSARKEKKTEMQDRK